MITFDAGGKRPQKASRDYVQQLMRECLLHGNPPDEIVKAVFALLIKRKVLTEQDGHVEIADHPGATLAFPPDAAGYIRSVVVRFASQVPRRLLDPFLEGCGPRGSGTGLPTSRADPDQEQTRKRGELERMIWEREQIVAEFGHEARPDMEILVDHQIRHLQADFGDPKAEFRFQLINGLYEVNYGQEHDSLRATEGLRIIGALLQHPNKEMDVTDLDINRTEMTVSPPQDVVDSDARTAIKKSERELLDSLHAAEETGNDTMVARCQGELESLRAQTERDSRLGGRPREFSDSREKCRDRVRDHLKRAQKRIGENMPQLQLHLQVSIKRPSGFTPSYAPVEEVRWAL